MAIYLMDFIAYLRPFCYGSLVYAVLWQGEVLMPSRQYLWQMKQHAKGNCIICGKPRVHYQYRCDACTAKQRDGARERNKNRSTDSPPALPENLAVATPQPESRLQ